MALEIPKIRKKLEALTAVLRSSEPKDVLIEQLIKHFKDVDSDSAFRDDVSFEFPSNDPGMWFNCSPMSFQKDLKGKIVILDFFTYCCVNCLHILPDLARLEEKYPVESGVVVVGAHSAKFPNEKVSDNIRSAILRYDITHPVVNDPDIELWNHLAITCWPTLVIFGPEGQLLHSIIGEGHGEECALLVDQAVRFYGGAGRLAATTLPLALLRDAMPPSGLRFPGKVCVSGERLFISDSGHHRILEVSPVDGRVSTVIGSGEAGSRDGSVSSAQFSSPQGLAVRGNHLFVADSENHAIRAIDLKMYTVTTIVGTGCQGNDKEGGKVGTAQEISSPWDLAIGQSADADILYIAMSGVHQIWAYFFERTKWLQGVEVEAGVCLRFSGSGEELNKYNSYPHKAGFAQPSGITVATGGGGAGVMYVADSESSTVRTVQLDSGGVLRCVGGGLDPTDLFAHGDRDGSGRNVRLQHPLGVVWDEAGKALYLADSYNHKIKRVDVAKKTCKTLAGTGVAGKKNGLLLDAEFSEPGGLCLAPAGDKLYVADTNNCCVRVLDLAADSVQEFPLHFGPKEEEETQQDHLPDDKVLSRPSKRLAKGAPSGSHLVFLSGPGRVAVRVEVALPKGHRLTEGAPSKWQLWTEDDEVESPVYGGAVLPDRALKFDLLATVSEQHTPASALVEFLLFYCDNEGTCRSKASAVEISVHYRPGASLEEQLNFSHLIL